ncbi:MAG: response regulator [Calditrichaeota bacterium]|nr:MAG: response regulator [Calditrichota bacterium]MBL1204871.1 response regulator [Calditrichota bacterium]NOG44700.1 response regulator [Calditrichota bacterium]
MKKPHVLIIDNLQETAELISEVLSAQGYLYSVAGNEKEAFELIKNFDIKLVIIDFHIKGLSGAELFLQLQKRMSVPAVLFLNVFSYSEEYDQLEISSPNAILNKPFSIDEFVKTVSELLP